MRKFVEKKQYNTLKTLAKVGSLLVAFISAKILRGN